MGVTFRTGVLTLTVLMAEINVGSTLGMDLTSSVRDRLGVDPKSTSLSLWDNIAFADLFLLDFSRSVLAGVFLAFFDVGVGSKSSAKRISKYFFFENIIN